MDSKSFNRVFQLRMVLKTAAGVVTLLILQVLFVSVIAGSTPGAAGQQLSTDLDSCVDCVATSSKRSVDWHPLFQDIAKWSPGHEILIPTGDGLEAWDDRANHTEGPANMRPLNTGGSEILEGIAAPLDAADPRPRLFVVLGENVADHNGKDLHDFHVGFLDPESGFLWESRPFSSKSPPRIFLVDLEGDHEPELVVATKESVWLGNLEEVMASKGQSGFEEWLTPSDHFSGIDAEQIALAKKPSFSNSRDQSWCQEAQYGYRYMNGWFDFQRVARFEATAPGPGGQDQAFLMVLEEGKACKSTSYRANEVSAQRTWIEVVGKSTVLIFDKGNSTAAPAEPRVIIGAETIVGDFDRSIPRHQVPLKYQSDRVHTEKAEAGQRFDFATVVPVLGDFDGDGRTDLTLAVGAHHFSAYRINDNRDDNNVYDSGDHRPYSHRYLLPLGPIGNLATGIAPARTSIGFEYQTDCSTEETFWGLAHDTLALTSPQFDAIAVDLDGDGRDEIGCIGRDPHTGYHRDHQVPDVVLAYDDGLHQYEEIGHYNLADGFRDKRVAFWQQDTPKDENARRLEWPSRALAAWDHDNDGAQSILLVQPGKGTILDMPGETPALTKAFTYEMVGDADRFVRGTVIGRPIPIDLDTDGVTVRWLGATPEHVDLGHILYVTEPQVYAVIAGPPIVEGIGQDWGSSSLELSYETCNGWDQASGTSSSSGKGISIGLSLGTVAAVDIFSLDFAVVQERWRESSYGEELCFSGSKGFTSNSGRTAVLFKQSPIDIYTYEIVGAPSIDLIGERRQLTFEGKPRIEMWDIDDYQAAVREFNERITDGIVMNQQPALVVPECLFKHSPGDPRTFHSRTEAITLVGVPDIDRATYQESSVDSTRIPETFSHPWCSDVLIPAEPGNSHVSGDKEDRATTLNHFAGISDQAYVSRISGETSVSIGVTESSFGAVSYGESLNEELSISIIGVAQSMSWSQFTSRGWSLSSSTGTAFETSVPSIVDAAEFKEHNYAWGMFTYPALIGNSQFSVVDHWADQYNGGGPTAPPPGAPSLIGLAMGQLMQAGDEIQWLATQGAVSYEVHIRDGASIAEPTILDVESVEGAPNESLMLPQLPGSDNYRIHVVAVLASGEKLAGPIVLFDILAEPTDPVVRVSTAASFGWALVEWTMPNYAGITGYEIRTMEGELAREIQAFGANFLNQKVAYPNETTEVQVRAIYGEIAGPWGSSLGNQENFDAPGPSIAAVILASIILAGVVRRRSVREQM
jgi:hypothetical protein